MTETDQITILALRKPEEGLRKTAKTHKRMLKIRDVLSTPAKTEFPNNKRIKGSI